MIEKFIVITNNTLSKKKLEDDYNVEFLSIAPLDLLYKVRDYIHLGHRLLTHPLMSSVKPNETPFRTVLISKDKEKQLDMDSLNIIENSINTTKRFLNDFDTPNWTEEILQDFQLIDYDLVHHAID
nr:GrdX family protein [Clostridium algidicarnis]